MQNNKPARFLSDEELTELVRAVEAREAGASSRLYNVMRGIYRYWLSRQLGPDHWEDPLHNAYLAVLSAIQQKRITRPAGILGYAHTILVREIATDVKQKIRYREKQGEENPDPVDRGSHPDSRIDYSRRVAIMLEALKQLSDRDQELLRRFYLLEQSEAQIREEMGLTDTQFRLYKSRAKSRLGIRGTAIQKQTLRKRAASV